MPGFSPIVRVELSAHAHATEDVDRVLEAVLNLLPEELRGRVKPLVQTVEGHHGNPITRIVVRLEGQEAEEFLRGLASRLSEQDKRILRFILESRYDEKAGRFYLRLSKQDAYQGRLVFSDGDDVVHVMISVRGSPRLERALRMLEEAGLLS